MGVIRVIILCLLANSIYGANAPLSLLNPFVQIKPLVGSSCTTLSDTNLTGTTVNSINIGSFSGTTYVSTSWYVTNSSYTPCKVDLRLSKTGTPTFNIQVGIFTATNEFPSVQLGSWSANFAVSQLTTSLATYTITVPSGTVTIGQTNCIVVQAIGAPNDFSNYITWGGTNVTARQMGNATTLSSWAVYSASTQGGFNTYQ